ncbi:YafY family transcriptional regulator (plasmid) [Deinococcus sp. KNUC1210]|uniref:helix-turn-helix transcriptional regulator n=1 Tax=Deinococcus sp. KNUC1210 TaxID=2917691 RepID=UPI001EF0C4B0|nr:YafY family protein [Deinococcus sp. KNUC1210]ULH17629.1 YafY family transcriptional regulator [Deinococcus sp. KNUC1210]
MNRTDRLLAIVLELQGQGRVRAEDLAGQLEVSRRTIYRDVLALNEAGVPIVSVPGQGYTLMPGYFLPPLRFSVDEAVMLLLGSEVMTQAFGAGPADEARNAARKIRAVLSERVQQEVQFLRHNIRFVEQDSAAEETQERLRALRQAIVERHAVEFSYHKPQARAETRHVDPHGLYRLNQVWLLAAFDHARSEFRSFRLDRIEQLRVLPEQFERQPNFTLQRDETREGRELVVQALFSRDAAREVRHRLSYYVTRLQDTPDGLLVTLHVRAAEEIVPWLLSWAGRVRVLEPVSIQLRLLEAAQEIVRSSS